MGDLDRELNASSTIKIAGRSEELLVDVVQEDGVNKLLVKSTTVPDTLGNLVFTKAENGGSFDMAVNGGGNPVVFTINSHPTFDTIVSELILSGFDNGIKIDTFMGQNSALGNGLLISITSNGVTSNFNLIKNTAEFNNHFSLGKGSVYTTFSGSGNDYISGKFSPAVPFKLIAGTADNISVTVQDNLNNVSFLEMQMFGTLDT